MSRIECIRSPPLRLGSAQLVVDLRGRALRGKLRPINRTVGAHKSRSRRILHLRMPGRTTRIWTAARANGHNEPAANHTEAARPLTPARNCPEMPNASVASTGGGWCESVNGRSRVRERRSPPGRRNQDGDIAARSDDGVDSAVAVQVAQSARIAFFGRPKAIRDRGQIWTKSSSSRSRGGALDL